MARPQCVCDTPLALVVAVVVVLVVVVVHIPYDFLPLFPFTLPSSFFFFVVFCFQKLSWGVCVLLTADFHSLLFCCFVSMLKVVVVFKLGVDELVAQHFLLHLSLRFLIADQ
jgi:hypothetical protein